MLTQSRFSYLIEVTEKIVAAVTRMTQSYLRFPALIDAEHRMIQSHTYTLELEEITIKKSQLADEITMAFNDLQQLASQLFIMWNEAECEGQASFPGDLGNCVRMVEGIRKGLSGDDLNLSAGILDFQIKRLNDAYQNFTEVMKTVKGKIELNRSALSGIVQNYQNSTRVLIELCEQAQAIYSPDGQTQRPSTGTSTIFVKA